MIKHVSFDDYGYLDGASITGTYQNLLTLSDDADVILVFNSLDQAVLLQVPNKSEQGKSATTKEIRLPATSSFALDARTNSKRFAKGIIKIKHAGVVPTTGTEISITALR